jgi:hypothetical protein
MLPQPPQAAARRSPRGQRQAQRQQGAAHRNAVAAARAAITAQQQQQRPGAPVPEPLDATGSSGEPHSPRGRARATRWEPAPPPQQQPAGPQVRLAGLPSLRMQSLK